MSSPLTFCNGNIPKRGLKVRFNSAQRKALGVNNNHCIDALKVQAKFHSGFQPSGLFCPFSAQCVALG